ncbi:MAG: P1 family peptidase [Rhodothalassiaceae bacterium]
MHEVRISSTGHDRITDIAGLAVGNAEDRRARTGTTVVLPQRPATVAVDTRGGAPGSRETDALDPSALVACCHGLVLTGGSVFGLAAADGVTQWLSSRGRGLPIGGFHVPVVPAAVLFDLLNGGDKNWGEAPPYRALGIAAAEAAATDFATGRAGAGLGAVAGDRAGGLGTAAAEAASGFRVGALVAVNSFGPPRDQDMARIPLPKAPLLASNTTIAVVATDLALDKAACRRIAIMAHDGLARALRPIHTPFDGDTVFALATGAVTPPAPAPLTLTIAGTMAADLLERAVCQALEAAARQHPDGGLP